MGRARAFLVPLAVFGALALFPLAFPGEINWIGLGFLTFIFITLAIAWNLVGGFAGQVSFGYAAFFGTGAYVTAILWSRHGWDPVATLPLAGFAALVVALVVGLPCFRLEGPYFSIATIGVGEATRVLALNLDLLTPDVHIDPLAVDLVLVGVVRVDMLDVHVLRVEISVGQAPGDAVIVADHDSRIARQ